MIEITNARQFYDMVNAFKQENANTLTNCFFMPDEVTALAGGKRLFAINLPEWLLILCKRDDYCNLYYYATEAADASFVAMAIKELKNNSIFLDVVSRGGRGDFLTPEKLTDYGCAEKYKTYQRMQLPLKNIDFNSLSPKLAEGYTLSYDYCNYNALSKLWKEALDEKSTPLPTENELIQLAKEGKLLTVHSPENEPAGVVMLSVTAKQGLVQHLVVSANHQRKGLARFLMTMCQIRAQQLQLNMLRLWVDCCNTSAIALYDNLNYKTDGMLCHQLYMKGN